MVATEACPNRLDTVFSGMPPQSAASPLCDQERVLKTVLLLEAVSQVVSNVSLLRPTSKNIDLAFSETGWQKGKAMNIAEGLYKQGILFERSVGNGMKEYTVANSGAGGADITKLKNVERSRLKTQDLIISADLMSAVSLPAAIRERYNMEGAAYGNFPQVLSRASSSVRPDRFKVVVTFAMNDDEAAGIRSSVAKAVVQPNNELFFIESLVPMGKDLIDAYCGVANTANSNKATESGLAERIGKMAIADSAIKEDMERLLTNEMCRRNATNFSAA